MSKKLSVLLGAIGLEQFEDLPTEALYVVAVYIVAQAAVDCVLAWRGVKRG